MRIHKDSHLDHGLTQDQVNHIAKTFEARTGFFIETIELPEHLGTAPCALYGKTMGDAHCGAGSLEVQWMRRGDRPYESRCIRAEPRPSRLVTVIAGPHGKEECVLYTAFGGPLAPKEIGDPTLRDEEREESEKFWAEHALAVL